MFLHTDNHDIISVDAKNLYATNLHRSGPGKSNPHRKSYSATIKPSGNWDWSFWKFIIFIIVCGGVYVGWVAYRTQRRTSRFWDNPHASLVKSSYNSEFSVCFARPRNIERINSYGTSTTYSCMSPTLVIWFQGEVTLWLQLKEH